MASYIPNITDNSQQIPVAATMPQSNYQFLQTQMDKANAMYESGLQEVKSGYASIVNAPVTGIEANERKQKYIQQAQNKLRTLSSKDLSLPQNVAQAETAYAPFWEDDLLVTNSAYTRKIGKENSQLDSWLYSTDEDTRKLYSDKNRQAIQEATLLLANAPMTKEGYAGLLSTIQDKAKAIPYYDIEKEALESFKEMYGAGVDKGVSAVHLGNGMMNTVYNGPESFPAYKTWFLSQMSDKYMPQLRQQAWVEVQQRTRKVMAENPEITDPKQVNMLLAKDRMKELQEVNANAIKMNSDMMDVFANQLNDLHYQVYVNQRGRWDDSQRQQEQIIQRNLQLYTNGWENARTQSIEYSELIDGKANDRYLKTVTDIATNPIDYLTNININKMADRWATGMASISSEKVEVDPLEHEKKFWQNEERKHWVDVQKLYQEDKKIAQEERKMALTARGQAYDLYKATGKLTPFGKTDPGFRGGGSGSGKSGWASGSTWNGIPDPDISPVTTNVQKVNVVLEAEKAIKKPLYDAVMGQQLDITSPGGFGTIVLGQNGLQMSDKNMEIFRNYMGKMMEQGKVPPTPEEAAQWNSVKEKLYKEGVIKSVKDITGPMTMFSALNSYAEKVSKKLGSSTLDNKKDLQDALALSAQGISSSMQQYIDGRNKFDSILQQSLMNSPTGEPNPLVVVENGKKRLIQGTDIYKDAPGLELSSGNETLKMSPKEFADAMATGRVEVREPETLGSHTSGLFSSNWDIKIDGVEYKVNRLTAPENARNTNLTLNGIVKERPKDLVLQDYGFEAIGDRNNRSDIADALWRYTNGTKLGNINEFSNKWKKANENVASTLGYKDGLVYQAAGYDVNDQDEDKANFGVGLAKEASLIANTHSFYEYPSGEKDPVMYQPTKADDAQKIAQIRNVLSSDTQIRDKVAKVEVIKGLGEVAITFKEQYGKDRPDFAGKTIYMKYTPTAKGKYMDAIPSGVVSGPMADLLNGKVYKSSELMNNSGRTWELTPMNKDAQGNYTLAMLNIAFTDSSGVKQSKRIPIPLVGPYAKSPMQISQMLQQDDAAYFMNASTTRKVNSQTIAAKPQ